MAGVSTNPDFEDFDIESIYNTYENAALDLETKNVMIEFSSDHAIAVRDVDHVFMKKILESEKVRKTKEESYRADFLS